MECTGNCYFLCLSTFFPFFLSEIVKMNRFFKFCETTFTESSQMRNEMGKEGGKSPTTLAVMKRKYVEKK